MDVTNQNFLEALTLFKSHLTDAHFVAVDLEFTGLGESRPSQLDTPAVRYRSAREDAERFPPIQFGIAIFKRVRDNAVKEEAHTSAEGKSKFTGEGSHADDVAVRRKGSRSEDTMCAGGEGWKVSDGSNVEGHVTSAGVNDVAASASEVGETDRDTDNKCGVTEGCADGKERLNERNVWGVVARGGAEISTHSHALALDNAELRAGMAENAGIRVDELDETGIIADGGTKNIQMDVDDMDKGNDKNELVSMLANDTSHKAKSRTNISVERNTTTDSNGVTVKRDGVGNASVDGPKGKKFPVSGDNVTSRHINGGTQTTEVIKAANTCGKGGGVESVDGDNEGNWDWQWHVIPFNFNVFPRAVYYPPSARYPKWDRVFNLQSSTVNFLLRHGFNFHKICHGGVGWIRQEVEHELRQHVTTILRKVRTETKKEANKSDRKVIPKYREMINEWIEKLGDGTGIKMFSLPQTGVQRRLVYDMIRETYPRVVAGNLMTQEGQQLKLTRFANEEEAAGKREEALVTEIEEEISKHVAFRYVIDAVRKAEIPIVAHNAMLDLAKVYANFIESMPEKLGDFKRKFREHFPFVYDTRLMLLQLDKRLNLHVKGEKHHSISDTVGFVKDALKKMGKEAVEPVIFVPTGKIYNYGSHLDKGFMKNREAGFAMTANLEEGEEIYDFYEFGRYSGSSREHYEHEAGFDALETGRLFTMLLQLAQADGILSSYDKLSADLLGVRNKIFLGSCGGYRYVDLEVDHEDEPNDHFESGNAIVVSGVIKEGEAGTSGRLEGSPYHRLRQTLAVLTTGTSFDPVNSTLMLVGPESMLALLKRKDEHGSEVNGKRTKGMPERQAKDLQSLIRRGQELGVRVESYESAVTHVDPSIKRRKCV